MAADGRRARLRRLRAEIHALEQGAGVAGRRVLPLGVAALDRHLPGGGLPLAGLHEIAGARAEWDDGAATGFCLAVLARLLAGQVHGRKRGAVLWVARWRDLYAPGLATFGIDPGRLILVRAGSEANVFWALEEGLRCTDLAAVVGEADDLDRAAGRRLQLAAEAGGRPAFVLRRRLYPAGRGANALAGAPSGALSRWRITPAHAATVTCPAGQSLTGGLLGGARDAALDRLPGRPRWTLELLRCRGTAPGQWLVEWDAAAGGFSQPAARADPANLSGLAASSRPPGKLQRAV